MYPKSSESSYTPKVARKFHMGMQIPKVASVVSEPDETTFIASKTKALHVSSSFSKGCGEISLKTQLRDMSTRRTLRNNSKNISRWQHSFSSNHFTIAWKTSSSPLTFISSLEIHFSNSSTLKFKKCQKVSCIAYREQDPELIPVAPQKSKILHLTFHLQHEHNIYVTLSRIQTRLGPCH